MFTRWSDWMKELDLNEIKKTEIDLLKRLKVYCEENNLKYYLSNGTLLGAVKYKGFIPWDDDIDVIMPRADYEYFVKTFPSDEAVKLLHEKTCKNYIFPFAKLSDTSTTIENQTALKGYEYGVHIDIFPLDFWNSNINKAKEDAVVINKICQELCFSISRFCKGRSLICTCVKNLIIAYTRIWGWQHYHRKLRDAIEERKGKDDDACCGCLVWPVYGIREIFPREVFSESDSVEFEGMAYPAPIGYDAYLRSLYGDYEKDPPLEKQRSHHRFRAYKK